MPHTSCRSHNQVYLVLGNERSEQWYYSSDLLVFCMTSYHSDTVTSEPDLYKLLTFQVPNLISVFRRLDNLSKESISVRGSCVFFINLFFLRWGVVSPTPNPQAGGPHLVVRPRRLIQYIHSWRPTLHLQPENVPCCGNSDPPNMEILTPLALNMLSTVTAEICNGVYWHHSCKGYVPENNVWWKQHIYY
jgi:hypothetical protein